MLMEADKNMLVLPAEAKLSSLHHPATATLLGRFPHRGGICVLMKERVMRMSSNIVAPSTVALMSAILLCGLTGTAMSQTAASSTLPDVTVAAPKQVARSHHGPVRTANTGVGYRRAPGVRTTTQTGAGTSAPGSVMARLKELERTSSNCNDGCQTSFKYGNQPWNGCSASGGNFQFSTTCRNVRNFKTYVECTENGVFLAWRTHEVWWYCSSLLAGGKLAGEKVQVAEVGRSGRR
jgi:hypothetical protein